MAKLRITQVRSTSGSTKKQIANLRSLGIHRMHHTVEIEKNPISEGMVAKVHHLVKVEEI